MTAWTQNESGWRIHTIAGTGRPGHSGDGGPASEARFSFPTGVAVDKAGNLYIADFFSQRIRRVNATGTITTIAGQRPGNRATAETAARRLGRDCSFAEFPQEVPRWTSSAGNALHALPQ